MIRQQVGSILSVPASTVVDGTYTVYVNAHNYTYHNFQVLLTPGIAGTMDCRIYGAVQDGVLGTEDTFTYEDMTRRVFKIPSVTETALLISTDPVFGMLSWIKIEAVIASSDPTTAISIWHKSKE